MSIKTSVESLLGTLERKTGKTRQELGFEKGAAEEDLAKLAAALPNFPAELRGFLEVVNGQNYIVKILPTAYLQSAEEILQEWADLCENVDEEQFGGEYQDNDRVKLFNGTKGWIPLAWDDDAGGGIYHYIDMDPGPSGKPGQVIQAMSECDFEVIAGSLTELIDRITVCFEAGALRLEQDDGNWGLWWDTDEYWQTLAGSAPTKQE